MNIPDRMTLQATIEQDDAASSENDQQLWSNRFAWLARLLILAALVIAPWLIGSVGHTAQFWLSAAILLALALWWFETALNSRSSQVLPYISLFVLFGIGIGLLQLVPLSGSLQNFLLGRQVELFSEYTSSGVGSDTESTVRATLNSVGTWGQLRLLVLSLAAMLLACRYFRAPRHLTLFFAVMSANGVALSLFGIIQKLTSDGQTLYWSIPLNLGGNPFGPYVNRNNGAGYLLMCLGCAVGLMVMVMSVKKNPGPVPIISKEIPIWRQFSQQILYFISELTAPKLAALMSIVFISAGIVASLSRGAVLALLVATLITMVCYGIAKKPKNLGVLLLPLFLTVFAMTVWLGFGNDLISRFDQVDSTQELQKWDARISTWTDTWESVGEMGKLGAGLGSYDKLSRLYRSTEENRVFTHAENQFVQALVESGWLGLIAFVLAWLLAFYYSYFLMNTGQSPATVSVGVAGIFLLWSQLVASLLDFGLYLPANAITFASIVGVIAYYAHSMAYRLKRKTLLRFQFPNTLVQILLVGLFGASTLVMLDLNRKSSIDALKSPVTLGQDSLSLVDVDARIKSLSQLAKNSSSVDAMNELGRLGVHKTRLELYEYFKDKLVTSETDQAQLDRAWQETALVRLQGRSESLRRSSKLSQRNFLSLESIKANLPFAKSWFEESLKLSPMQPEVQIVLGELYSLRPGIDAARPHLERGIRLAPRNVTLLRQAAVLYLQAGRFEMAAPHLKNYLALVPEDFELMMQIATTIMKQEDSRVHYELIAEKMLPDDPKLFYLFATRYAESESLIQKTSLEKAEELLDQVSQSEFYVMALRGDIKFAMNDLVPAIDYYEVALVNNPNDDKVRYRLIEALVGLERYKDALNEAERLIRSDEKNPRYQALYDGIKSKLEEE